MERVIHYSLVYTWKMIRNMEDFEQEVIKLFRKIILVVVRIMMEGVKARSRKISCGLHYKKGQIGIPIPISWHCLPNKMLLYYPFSKGLTVGIPN